MLMCFWIYLCIDVNVVLFVLLIVGVDLLNFCFE